MSAAESEVILMPSADERLAVLEAGHAELHRDIVDIRKLMSTELREMRQELKNLAADMHSRPSRTDVRMMNLLVALTSIFATGLLALVVAFIQTV